LGDWVIPQDYTVMASVQLAHESKENFPDASSFDPDRFVGTVPKPVAWIPFGGGINRCIGAAFANMEMDVTLRTMLREVRFVPTDAPGERAHNRGVAFAPGRGARAVIYRRRACAPTKIIASSTSGHVSTR
jgi:cytochrome P450